MILEPILNLLFPQQCVVCGIYDTPLCEECIAANLDVEHIVLPTYAPIASITTLGEYAKPAWKRAVKALKFSSLREVSPILGELLSGAIAKELLPQLHKKPIIVPIPLHKKRLRERGYNQTALIGRSLSNITGWPLNESILMRSHYSAPQSSIEHEARAQNISGAYTVSANTSEHIAEAPLILVDDVITTGATILEAAHTLKQHTKTTIYVVAVARGS